ncbi:MAG: histone, partial [Burkholderiaceae bacterium]|nr:histone [Burkholderiaceae bacterium]MDO7670628.1 histone [Burkholderiaceae bacterium]
KPAAKKAAAKKPAAKKAAKTKLTPQAAWPFPTSGSPA